MPSKRLSVVVTRRLPEAVETRLTELFDVRLRDDDTPMSRPELAAAMADADVLVPTITDQIDAGLIGQAGNRLKLIANFGAGVDHIDVETARRRGILVSNTPGAMTDDTADMVMGLMLAVTRRMQEGLSVMQSGEWQGKAGGYGIQGLAEAFIPWISGSFSGVVGLPLAETAAVLNAAGYPIYKEQP